MPTQLDQAALGRAARAIRDERGLSQVQLAAANGLAQAWISQIENGKRNPSWSNVQRLADGLGTRLSELVKRAEMLAEAPKPAPKTARLASRSPSTSQAPSSSEALF